MGRRAQETDITPWGVRSPGTLRDNCKGAWKQGISVYGTSVSGTWRRGSFSRGPEGYERKTVEMGISLYWGSVGINGVGSSTGEFQIWLKGDLEVECLSLSLCVSSLKGTWREGSLPETLKDIWKRL